MSEVRLKISPPWITFIHKIQALFDADPQIACNIVESSKEPSITLACNNGDKNAALLKLLPEKVEYGKVTLKIAIDGPISNLAFKSNKDLFETAFKGNPVFVQCVAPVEEGYWWVDFTYVIFKNTVVQFFNDNLNDAHGLISTLYQDIAEEVFSKANLYGVYYCTDIERKLGKPLGEWP